LPAALAAPAAAAANRPHPPGCPDQRRRTRWDRADAAFARASARLDAFRAAEAALPPERRAFPACEPLEERFGDLECARLAALARLLRAPAPDLPAFARKIHLAIDDQAWELASADHALAALKSDAHRLCGA
jgi:hypothetical protein